MIATILLTAPNIQWLPCKDLESDCSCLLDNPSAHDGVIETLKAECPSGWQQLDVEGYVITPNIGKVVVYFYRHGVHVGTSQIDSRLSSVVHVELKDAPPTILEKVADLVRASHGLPPDAPCFISSDRDRYGSRMFKIDTES